MSNIASTPSVAKADGGVLVTGGSGVLGSQVVQRMATTLGGDRLWLASHSPYKALDPDVPRAQRVILDLTRPEFSLPDGISTLVHIAGEKRDATRMQAVNDDGTRRLVLAAGRAGVQRFVHVSSVGVYGAGVAGGIVDETRTHHPDNAYEVSKDAGEAAVRTLCREHSMEFVIVQPSNVLALVPGLSHPLLGLMRIVKAGRFIWLGRAEAWANYVAIEDVAEAIAALTVSGPSDATFIINTPHRLADVVGWCAQALGVAAPRRRAPLWVGNAASIVARAAAKLSGQPARLDRNRLAALINTTRYDGSAITRATGFVYRTGVEATIRTLAANYQRENLL